VSYEKAMKHTRNVRKSRMQGRMYFGFDTGSRWGRNPRQDPLFAALADIRDWFSRRHDGDAQHNRECIREAIAEVRHLRSARPEESLPARLGRAEQRIKDWFARRHALSLTTLRPLVAREVTTIRVMRRQLRRCA
jgi:hypothetical protein